ncbi:MAG TPA: chemotaxis protein CheX [Desulfobulbus sp.]|nr:chemotaxis protein CheX [Desulfobulbus sp.]
MQLDRFIIDATTEVFASMVFMELVAGDVIREDRADLGTNISSMIGLAGDLKGLLSVHCPRQVALAVSGAMLGMEPEELDDDVKDAMGEIANMVAGGLKASLLEAGSNVELAIPTTVVGNSIRTSGFSGASTIIVPFSVPDGDFAVELNYVLG